MFPLIFQSNSGFDHVQKLANGAYICCLCLIDGQPVMSLHIGDNAQSEHGADAEPAIYVHGWVQLLRREASQFGKELD